MQQQPFPQGMPPQPGGVPAQHPPAMPQAAPPQQMPQAPPPPMPGQQPQAPAMPQAAPPQQMPQAGLPGMASPMLQGANPAAQPFAFESTIQSQEKAIQGGGGLTGFSMPTLRIDSPQDANGAVDFAFAILPGHDGITAGDVNSGSPSLPAKIYKGFAGGSNCFYSPEMKFPGSSAPCCDQDLFRAQVDQVFQQHGLQRFTKDVDLNNSGQEALATWRRGMSPNQVRMLQVWEFDPTTLQPLYEADGSPKVVLWAPGKRTWDERNWEHQWSQLCASGVSPCNPSATVIFRGQRRGKGQYGTSYTCVGIMGAGGSQQPGPIADPASIQAALAKVRPWQEVLDIPTIEDQQRYVGALPYLGANQAAQGAGQPQVPQPAQTVVQHPGVHSPGAGIPQLGGVGGAAMPQAPAMPVAMPAPAPDATPAQPGVPPAAPHQPPAAPHQAPPPPMPQPGMAPQAPPPPQPTMAPGAPPTQQPGMAPHAAPGTQPAPMPPAAPPMPQAPQAAAQPPQQPVTPAMPTGYPGPAGAPQPPGYAPPPSPNPAPPMR